MTWQTIRERVLPFVPLVALAAAVVIWAVAREVWAGEIAGRVTAIEAKIEVIAPLVEQGIRTEVLVEALRNEAIPRLNRIEDKLDRVIEGR